MRTTITKRINTELPQTLRNLSQAHLSLSATLLAGQWKEKSCWRVLTTMENVIDFGLGSVLSVLEKGAAKSRTGKLS